MNALDELHAAIFKWRSGIVSMIKPTLIKRNKGYLLQLVEFTEDNSYHTNKLDKCIDWVTGQLKTWPDCKRMSWDMWYFENRKDAEKFVTVFHLSCPVK